MKKIIILSLIIILLTGCYDNQELNNLNIVTAIGFDKIDDEYLISLEITKNKDSENGLEKNSTIITGQDKDFAIAIEKAKNNSDKIAYFKHVDTILINEEIAKEGIGFIMDYLLRKIDISTTYYTVICANANDLLNIKNESDTTSNKIVSTITSHINTEILNNVDIIISNIINERKDIALPYVSNENNELLISSKAYFNKDKMVGTIDNKIYNFLLLGNKNIVFQAKDNALNIYDSKISYDINKDNITINIKCKGSIETLKENLDLNKKTTYEYLETEIENTINEETTTFLNTTLNNNSDLLGLKDLYYKKYKIDNDNISFNVKTKITLITNGIITEVIHD